MHEAASPRRPLAAPVAFLLLIAAAGLIATVAVEAGTRAQTVVASATSAAGALAAAAIVAGRGRANGWPAARGIAAALALAALAALAIGSFGALTSAPFGPRWTDVALLALAIPLLAGIQREFQAHFDPTDRRDIAMDVWLLAASVAALLYLVIRPLNADAVTSASAATFAFLAATQLVAFGVLTLWVATPVHLAQFMAFATYSIATVRVGSDWVHGTYAGGPRWVSAAYLLAPIALALAAIFLPHGRQRRAARRTRIVRPVLASTTIIGACATLGIVAIADEARGLAGLQSAAIVAFLGLSVALRIVANQVQAARAHDEVREALAHREIALREADAALERVREANETLRASEEHLRLVIDAAVDGFVELDDRGVILRANRAFAEMVGLGRRAIEGTTWSALAASVEGADPSFAELTSSGTATIARPDGQVLHLESRASTVPSDPPRTLMLVRDVTAATVADRTIRSLLQFLQDRDEDRTRLLRRTNAAIEAERNRIARDLHDGPVQGVSAASLSLEAALLMIKAGDVERGIEVLTKIRAELAQEADALRRLMAGLRPPVLEERGLVPAIRDALARFGAERGIETSFTSSITESVPTDLETLAYRVVQEALSNAAKHAEAHHVSVVVEADRGALRVEVRDDGVGFDASAVREFLREGRVGLASMRERVELASGTFTVLSSPGRGTTITALLPLDASLPTVTVP
ncbi:MAG: hypothetical protein KatS3mg013_1304 [Actinomycetota bacterium]|jgi:PAS domain S-box-containing protein|nr:MAG: hypothetical protein KatS3mg013_1304 [Actinomycetota bacterium]